MTRAWGRGGGGCRARDVALEPVNEGMCLMPHDPAILGQKQDFDAGHRFPRRKLPTR